VETPEQDDGPEGRRRGRPPTLTPHRAFLAVVAVVLVGLLVAEVGTRLIADQLPSPGNDSREEVRRKQARLAELASSGGLEIVFFGNSMIDAGIDPARVAEVSQQLEGDVYNASLLGAPVYLQQDWLDDVAGGEASPDLAVVGIGPLDVVDWANPVGDGNEALTPAQQRLFENLVTDNLADLDDSLLTSLDRSASERSALIEHRGAMREPSLVLAAAARAATGSDPPDDVDRTDERWDDNLSADGQVQQFLDRQGAEVEGLVGSFLHRSLETTARTDRIPGIVELVQDHDVPVVVLVPPIDPSSVPPRTAQAYASLAQQIVAEAADLDVAVIDLSTAGYDPSAFADGIHLNAAGSQRFSDDVAVALDGVCASRPELRCAGGQP
jgi:hypothetical protein